MNLIVSISRTWVITTWTTRFWTWTHWFRSWTFATCITSWWLWNTWVIISWALWASWTLIRALWCWWSWVTSWSGTIFSIATSWTTAWSVEIMFEWWDTNTGEKRRTEDEEKYVNNFFSTNFKDFFLSLLKIFIEILLMNIRARRWLDYFAYYACEVYNFI